MIEAPKPDNEHDRQCTLEHLRLLNTPSEKRFDRITAFLAGEFAMPIALISLVDKDRQWFKSKTGLAAQHMPRTMSFCAHAVFTSQPLIVPDALLDARFADNPLVTGQPFIRFYAGAPLITHSGHVIGTLCMIDTQPRTLDDLDLVILSSVRNLVMQEIERTAFGRQV